MPQDELFGVESDEKSERKYFKVHKIVGNGIDLSKLQLRINYQNASRIPSGKDKYIVTDATVYNDEWVYFSWELSRKVTRYKGNIYFIVCAVKADSKGNITNEWNTTLAEGKVLEGLEVEINQEQQYQASDYLEQLKQQLLDYSKEIRETFPSDYTQMQDDIGSLKGDLRNERVRAITRENEIEELFTLPTQEAVNKWLDEHPEATTTVQDKSLVLNKFKDGELPFVTPQMFGAKGDGQTDDSVAFQDAINALSNGGKLKINTNKSYVIGNININKSISIEGSTPQAINCVGGLKMLNGSDYMFKTQDFDSTIQLEGFEIKNVRFNGNNEGNPNSLYL